MSILPSHVLYNHNISLSYRAHSTACNNCDDDSICMRVNLHDPATDTTMVFVLKEHRFCCVVQMLTAVIYPCVYPRDKVQVLLNQNVKEASN